MKYSASFICNNGTEPMTPLTGNNKKQLAKEIKQWAIDETFAGNKYYWYVLDADGREVLEGRGVKKF